MSSWFKQNEVSLLQAERSPCHPCQSSLVQVFMEQLWVYFTDKAVLQKSLYFSDSVSKGILKGEMQLWDQAKNIKMFEAVLKPTIISDEIKKQTLNSGRRYGFQQFTEGMKKLKYLT